MILGAISTSTALRIAALVGVGAGLGTMAFAVASGKTVLSRASERHVANIDRARRSCFRPPVGRSVLRGQVFAGACVLVGRALGEQSLLLPVLLIAIVFGPTVYFRRVRAQRLERLEQQVEPFVVALANALKTVPSPAAAIDATTMVLAPPMKEEIEQVLKEMRVGSTIEEGLLAMSARVKSRWVDIAFSSVLIGLRVGGDLPAVLERTASMIRELQRLLGVVRTRTSEGRAQLWVLALFPIVVVVIFDFVQPGYFDPMRSSFVGQLCIGVATLLWIASLLVGRKILAVDV